MKIDNVKISGPITRAYKEILTPEAIRFVAKLVRNFEARRNELLGKRQEKWVEIKSGKMPTFLQDQRSLDIRNSDWTVAPIKPDLERRYVEITGPAASRKMFINALNSGADCYMTDSEDSESPTWENLINGQINIRDAIDGSITYYDPAKNKEYKLKDKTATLEYRPRGWHLPEEHVLVDGKPISGSLFDFGLMIYHNAKKLAEKSKTPAFYLPKMESHEEAELWRDIFNFSEEELGIPHGTIRATVLIETILAAFEMDEILYGLKDYSAGLNAGRWDYLFSFIKKFSSDPAFVLPDRAQVTMDKQFLKSYVDLLVQTCHKRGIHAMGGMSALIPRTDDKAANELAIGKVINDKQREVLQGCDGAWAAHPGLVPHIRRVFEESLGGRPHQIEKKREDVKVVEADLLTVPTGNITEQGLRNNIKVSLGYLIPWLQGTGCVPINYLMEDLATVEISRSQVWQWLEHKSTLQDGRKVTWNLVDKILKDEVSNLIESANGNKADVEVIQKAVKLFKEVINSREFAEFLSLEAYSHITTIQQEEKLETKEEFIARLTREWKNPRWEGVARTYNPKDVWSIRGTVNSKHTVAEAGAAKFWNLINEQEPVRTLSAMTPHQAIQQVRAGLKAVYISGWQVASGANSYFGMFPDRSIYPVNSVPDLVEHINNVLIQADQIDHEKGNNGTSWLIPLIADAEAGFGDVPQTFELVKHLIRAGASSIHLEDQEGALKKCGHLGGKVLVPTREFIKKLITARFAADSLGVNTVLIARTDANSGALLKSDIDPYDHSFVDYSKGRTEEGYYTVNAGIDQAISRGLAYAPYADMLWFETSEPNLGEAKKFADAIHKQFPGKLLAYNCSPSFNWKAKLTNEEITDFQKRLGEMGYKFQFVTLSGYHSVNLSMFELAKDYEKRGMLAYSELQEAEFKAAKIGYKEVKHQEAVGTGYYDVIEKIVTGGASSTLALRGSTEEQQFHAEK